MKGTCENCGEENVYLYRVPIATPEGDTEIEMWCQECIDREEPEHYMMRVKLLVANNLFTAKLTF